MIFLRWGFYSLFLLFLVSCGKPSSLQNVTILYDWTPNTNHTGLYVAKQLGYFEEERLKVSLNPAPEVGAIELLLSNRVQMMVLSQEDLVQAVKAGIPIKAVAAILQHNTSAFASLKDKNIISPKDFAGRRYVGWGGVIEERLIATLMQKERVDPSQTEISRSGIEADLNALMTDQADYIWLYRGWDGIAADLLGQSLNYIFLKDYDNRLDYYTPIFVMTNSYIENQTEVAKALLKAVSKGYTLAATDSDQAVNLMLDAVPTLGATQLLASGRYLAPFYLDNQGYFGTMKAEVFAGYNAWMQENGMIDNPPAVELLFTNALLP